MHGFAEEVETIGSVGGSAWLLSRDVQVQPGSLPAGFILELRGFGLSAVAEFGRREIIPNGDTPAEGGAWT